MREWQKTKWNSRLSKNRVCCSHDGLHCAVRGLRRTQSSDWWENVVPGTFDDEMQRAYFIMCHRTFVRICGRLAPRLVRQDTSFRQTVSVEWHKRHSQIWTEWAGCPDWGCVCRNPIGIAFQTTLPCGSDLQKSDLMWFLLFRLKIKSVWICQKRGLNWQSEQGLWSQFAGGNLFSLCRTLADNLWEPLLLLLKFKNISREKLHNNLQNMSRKL